VSKPITEISLSAKEKSREGRKALVWAVSFSPLTCPAIPSKEMACPVLAIISRHGNGQRKWMQAVSLGHRFFSGL
jgi:hypothetical protein